MIARSVSFQTRAFLLLFTVSFVVSLVIGQYVYSRMQASLYEQIGIRARVQAQQIAGLPGVASAVARRDTGALHDLIMPLKAESDASYIVIGDEHALHLMHTEPDVALGSPMQGGDNDEVLHQGKSTISLKLGMHGMSWRGKAPIRDAHGKIIGVVSVGYFQSHIENWNRSQFMPLLALLGGILLALFCCAWVFAQSIKRQMFGLEPLEIAQMVRQREAVFESIYEGVLSIDAQRRITAVNRAAREMLELPQSSEELVNISLDELVLNCPFLQVGPNDADQKDEICLFNSLQVIASRVAIRVDKQVRGWVISFRRKDDISTLSLQLSEVKRYADNLRVVRHEHVNWVSTLAGLLHIKAYDEALKLAQAHSEVQQQVLDYISRTFGNYRVCGLLIGKYYRARELGLSLGFESGCALETLPDALDDVEWMSIIGNLLDNAFDATIAADHPEKKIVLYISDMGEELIIEVADFGCGIAPALRDHVFERGVSSHAGSEHGIGLYLVNSYVKQAAGMITIEDNIPYGTIFSVFVPKKRPGHAEH
ncbi:MULTISPECIES: ATP-binding protein [Silvimonas]|uniref:ATP-binding protein n=1 Tax=Silvimonas TaxID=300264 RepID=UPI0024B32E04|nr:MULTISPECIES: sensor histidine kinase [Silvimonas]MDR3426531.1 sensor histidine kinase [Silvimonas sp.]